MLRCGSALLVLLILGSPLFAVIKVLTPLKQVLRDEECICMGTVELVETKAPAVEFRFAENLKGTAPFTTMKVKLLGDAYAKKEGHAAAMLDRLERGQSAIFFLSRFGQGYSCFGFVEGTWFQLRGTKSGEAMHWEFLHAEPYLRRTFAGTSAELVQAIRDGLAGKRPAPEPDETVKPGFGPKRKQCRAEPGAALFAVIPSFVLVGPLAILAALFPGVAASLASGMKRRRALLVIAGIESTLTLLYFVLREFRLLPDHPFAQPHVLAGLLIFVTLCGIGWAMIRYRRMGQREPRLTLPPARRDVFRLVGITLLLGLLVGVTVRLTGWVEALYPVGTVIENQTATGMGQVFTAVFLGLVVSTLYAAYRLMSGRASPSAEITESVPRLSLSEESVGLVTMLLFSIVMVGIGQPRAAEQIVIESSDHAVLPPEVKLWVESPDYTEVLSGVVIDDSRVCFGVAKISGFRQSGAVLCVNRADGKELWRFAPDDLAPVFSTPAIHKNRIFLGEGLHTDQFRRLFCLNMETGRPAWPNSVPTRSHTEGEPAIVDGQVIFSAGDDGIISVNEADGSPRWQFPGAEQGLHSDSPVSVADGTAYAGSGYSTLAVFAIRVNDGSEVWRTPVRLRSFGPALLLGDRVAFGLGTGNLSEDISTQGDGIEEAIPSGAILCVNAKTGRPIWTTELPKSVHTGMAADGRTIYATCRDGYLYALNRLTGEIRWKRSLGAVFTCGPALIQENGVPLEVVTVSQNGLVAGVSPTGGEVRWTVDLREQTGAEVRVSSTPSVAATATGSYEIYFGATLVNWSNRLQRAGVFRITTQFND